MRQLPDATVFFVFVKAASRGIPLAARTPKLPNFSPHSRIPPNTRRTAQTRAKKINPKSGFHPLTH